MKTDIFSRAIVNRQQITFIYGLQRITVDPYLVAINKTGKKVVFGRVNRTNEIKQFEYDKIFNIRTFDNRHFSPIIPILPTVVN